jgi:RimJ/RimL family protein N-acetyltransferase
VANLEPVQLLTPADGDGGVLSLRPWNAADVEVVFEGFSDPDVAEWNPALPFIRRDQAVEWLERKAAGWVSGRSASWAVCLDTPDGAVIGSVGLDTIDRAREAFPSAHASISYWVLPSGRGRRVAARAAIEASRWALTDLGLPRVQLLHDLDNIGSCRVAARAGFALEGSLRRCAPGRDGWQDQHLHARIDGD